jgi:hypothetical protein
MRFLKRLISPMQANRKRHGNRARLLFETLEERRMMTTVHDVVDAGTPDTLPTDDVGSDQIDGVAGPDLSWQHQTEQFTIDQDDFALVETLLDLALDSADGDLADFEFALDPCTVSEAGTLVEYVADPLGNLHAIEMEYDIEGTIIFPALDVVDVASVTMVPGTATYPYLVEITIDLGDVPFEFDVDVEVAAVDALPGAPLSEISFDVSVEGWLEDVQIILCLTPPCAGLNQFQIDSVSVDAHVELDVDADLSEKTKTEIRDLLAWCLPPFNAIPASPPLYVPGVGLVAGNVWAATVFVEEVLAPAIEDGIEDDFDGLGGQVCDEVQESLEYLDFNDAVHYLDAWFWGLATERTDMVTSPADADSLEISSVFYCGTHQFANYNICQPPDDGPEVVNWNDPECIWRADHLSEREMQARPVHLTPHLSHAESGGPADQGPVRWPMPMLRSVQRGASRTANDGQRTEGVSYGTCSDRILDVFGECGLEPFSAGAAAVARDAVFAQLGC